MVNDKNISNLPYRRGASHYKKKTHAIVALKWEELSVWLYNIRTVDAAFLNIEIT